MGIPATIATPPPATIIELSSPAAATESAIRPNTRRGNAARGQKRARPQAEGTSPRRSQRRRRA
ncbi:uncharacterized protein N7515_001045 [Penicillium bovifimosum]|uniref:Uncharacterized protein n=1 Tax=Penicillium bovifimosum TaxID=126998 RepID=A0A9W9HFW5_9EURO|nr:uncharacterized protein N7515_001045 [Penicillium bovifimosum]KAJ5146481.1 hypothetical protein N7515_001045 [Penicillium bovifimosum]